MKDRIDGMLANDKNLQEFLGWVIQKVNSVEFSYKTVAVRAFYLSHAHAHARDLAPILNRELARDLNHDHDLALDRALALALNRDHDITLDNDYDRALEWVYALSASPSASDLDRIFDHALACASDRAHAHVRALDCDLDRALACASDLGDDVLRQALQKLKSQLPSIQEDFHQEDFYQWWNNHGVKWTKELRQVCIDLRNIGHNWQFTKEHKELLKKYYEANLLLVECMNRSYVSKQVREEIESTMHLPSKK